MRVENTHRKFIFRALSPLHTHTHTHANYRYQRTAGSDSTSVFTGSERSEKKNRSQKPNMHVIDKHTHPYDGEHVFISSDAGEKAISAVISSEGIYSRATVCFSACVSSVICRWSGVIDKEAWVKSARGRNRINLKKAETFKQSEPKKEE